MNYALIIIIWILACIWISYRRERAIIQEDLMDWAGRCADNAEKWSKEKQRCQHARFACDCFCIEIKALKRQLANRKGQITRLKNKLENMK